MKTAYIGIGSNLGEKTDNCLKAVTLMNRMIGCTVIERSNLYRTAPVGVEGQGWYANGVASLSTNLSARELLKNLLFIESEMGRVRRKKWESRIIDLDILIFGNEIIDENNLQIPHPLMHTRRFVLAPMVDVAPDLIHPSLGLSMTELLHRLPNDDQVVRTIR